MCRPLEWILTDDDSYQHVRIIDSDTFELIELCIITHEPDLYEVYTDTIRLSYYPEEEINLIIAGFGYSSIQHVNNEYGDKANQVIAECIFEHYGSFFIDPLVKEITYEAARAFIDTYLSQQKGGSE